MLSNYFRFSAQRPSRTFGTQDHLVRRGDVKYYDFCVELGL